MDALLVGEANEMTADEARQCVDLVVSHLESARQLLYELYIRSGWKALGYSSYSNMVEIEFKRSKSFASRQLAAAIMERRNDVPIGTISESTLRTVRSILPDPEHQDEMLSSYGSDMEVLAAAKRLFVDINGPSTLVNAVANGDIAINPAYEITNIYMNSGSRAVLVGRCSDPQLADLLTRLPDNSNTLVEIICTGHIPTVRGGHVPLQEATWRDLTSYLDYASNEHRQASVAVRRDEWEDAVSDLIVICERIVSEEEHMELWSVLCRIRNNSPRHSTDGVRSPT